MSSSDAEFFKSIGIDIGDSSEQASTVANKVTDPNSSVGKLIEINDKNSILPSSLAIGSVAVTSVILGFFGTMALARKKDGTSLDKALQARRGMTESGTKLAFRALGWGSMYAVGGFAAISLLIYQFSKFKLQQNLERLERERNQGLETKFKFWPY